MIHLAKDKHVVGSCKHGNQLQGSAITSAACTINSTTDLCRDKL